MKSWAEAVFNPGAVRIGAAEICRQVERLSKVRDGPRSADTRGEKIANPPISDYIGRVITNNT